MVPQPLLRPSTARILVVEDEVLIRALILLGKLATGAGSLPISFKNLVEGKSAHAERALVA